MLPLLGRHRALGSGRLSRRGSPGWGSGRRGAGHRGGAGDRQGGLRGAALGARAVLIVRNAIRRRGGRGERDEEQHSGQRRGQARKPRVSILIVTHETPRRVPRPARRAMRRPARFAIKLTAGLGAFFWFFLKKIRDFGRERISRRRSLNI